MPDKKPLEKYKEKRNFSRTPEPYDSDIAKSKKPVFVVQKHAASTLHYDFRLEVGGVLKSWAIPKGPSTDPKDKRLAVPTEDHPLEYASFEGVIPQGEYGAGSVIVWDSGTYSNLKQKDGSVIPLDKSVSSGHITVWLEGNKLKGGYAFIRTGKAENSSWLMIKIADEKARADIGILSIAPESVLSGLTIGQLSKL